MKTSKSRSEDLVFLIPGFLGFESFGNFSYFADRVSAALRASLERRLGNAVYVIPVPVRPTASFVHRQKALVQTMASRMEVFEHVDRVHLVGHSTGGVDAQLLTFAQPLAQPSWSDFEGRDMRPLRDRLRTVVSVASPHHGTCLAEDPLARFVAESPKLSELKNLGAFTALLGKLALSWRSDVDAKELIPDLGAHGLKILRFFQEVLDSRELVNDLSPTRMEALYKRSEGALPVRRASFVTVAGAVGADEFFLDLSRRTSGEATGCAGRGPHTEAALKVLRQAAKTSETWVLNPGIGIPSFSGQSNDGVVNSARQLIDPSDPRELAGLVIADHFDVVGYYDRSLWFRDETDTERRKRLISGLMHSGSGFGDDQFFSLYRRVADVIDSP